MARLRRVRLEDFAQPADELVDCPVVMVAGISQTFSSSSSRGMTLPRSE